MAYYRTKFTYLLFSQIYYIGNMTNCSILSYRDITDVPQTSRFFDNLHPRAGLPWVGRMYIRIMVFGSGEL